VTYADHENDLALAGFLQDRLVEIAQAAGAPEVSHIPIDQRSIDAFARYLSHGQ
jgi:hypothetical protein